MRNTEPVRVLPADVYDALELSALAFGGIGQPEVWRGDTDASRVPCCILGHVRWAGGVSHPAERVEEERALFRVDVGGIGSDTAVICINLRRGKSPTSRVTFKQWCKELNIVRGDS